MKSLTQAAEKTWEAINNKDLKGFASGVVESFNAQTTMFPAMAPYKENALGWKLSGAGGGGYLILISEQPIEGTMPIKIRRKGCEL